MYSKNGGSGGQWYLVGIIVGGLLCLSLPHLIFIVRACLITCAIVFVPLFPIIAMRVTRAILKSIEEQERRIRWYDPPRRPSVWRVFAMRRVW